MHLRKWFGIILGLGLLLALTPITALAWPGQYSQSPFQQGFSGHQPGGNAYGWRGQRPPMFRHNRPWARGRNPFQQQRVGQFQGYQNFGQPWMGQPQTYGVPYASPGFQGYPAPQPYAYSQPYPYGQPYGQYQGNQGLSSLLAWLLSQAQNYRQPYGVPYPSPGIQGNPYPQPYAYSQPYSYGQSQGTPNHGQPWTGHGQPNGRSGYQGHSQSSSSGYGRGQSGNGNNSYGGWNLPNPVTGPVTKAEPPRP